MSPMRLVDRITNHANTLSIADMVDFDRCRQASTGGLTLADCVLEATRPLEFDGVLGFSRWYFIMSTLNFRIVSIYAILVSSLSVFRCEVARPWKRSAETPIRRRAYGPLSDNIPFGYFGKLFGGIIPAFDRASWLAGCWELVFVYSDDQWTCNCSSLFNPLLPAAIHTHPNSESTTKMSLSGKTDNPSFVLRGIHDTVYEDVSSCPGCPSERRTYHPLAVALRDLSLDLGPRTS
jgi:hypothetical protein